MRLAVLLAVTLGFGVAQVTDWTGIYARVDKVVLEPNAQNPERIQIWGSFTVHKSMTEFSDPISGYLYFTPPPAEKLLPSESFAKMLTEWKDFTNLAGTNRVVALAWTSPLGTKGPTPLAAMGGARIRPAEEAPASPDPYKTGGGGAYMVNPGATYAAMQSLLRSH